MKPFNLEEAKAGKPVCTRDGRKARILCYDFGDNNYIIVAAIKDRHTTNEELLTYTKEGKYRQHVNNISNNDLMMASIPNVGWINLYKINFMVNGGGIYNSKEEAINHKNDDDAEYITTVKIRWEE